MIAKKNNHAETLSKKILKGSLLFVTGLLSIIFILSSLFTYAALTTRSEVTQVYDFGTKQSYDMEIGGPGELGGLLGYGMLFSLFFQLAIISLILSFAYPGKNIFRHGILFFGLGGIGITGAGIFFLR